MNSTPNRYLNCSCNIYIVDVGSRRVVATLRSNFDDQPCNGDKRMASLKSLQSLRIRGRVGFSIPASALREFAQYTVPSKRVRALRSREATSPR